MKKYAKYIILLIVVLTCLISICFIPISASKLIPVIENQVSQELGIKIHIEKLILRIGPLIKVKTPIMHLMYQDGQKFGQFDNVKFYISWTSIIKKHPQIKYISAKKLNIKLNSDDKYLPVLIKKMQEKEFSTVPNLYLKMYKFNYYDKNMNDNCTLEGQALELNKLIGYKNMSLYTIGNFSINNKRYLTYDINVTPKFDIENAKKTVDIKKLLTNLKEMDFYADIITDLKLYKNADNLFQASGFINIDNISISDIYGKSAKSFIYLTLLGNKASVLSNIYTPNNKKIYIDGMINNSSKPIIDLKVKSDEIRLSDLFNRLKVMANFTKLKDIDAINGTLSANFNLKGDLHKIKSNGYLKIKDASISSSGIEVEHLNSDIDFSNNKISFSNATGYVANAPIIARGTIGKNIDVELLMDKVSIKHLLPKEFGIVNGIASMKCKLSGTLDNIVHKETIFVENLKLLKNNNELNIDALKLDTNKDNIAYLNNIICNNKYTKPIKIPSAKIYIDNDKITIPNTNVYLPNSNMVLKSEIINYNNENLSFYTGLDGYINSKDINNLHITSEKYPVKISINGNKLVQNVSLQTALDRTVVFDEPCAINLSSKFEKNNLKIEDLSIIAYNGKLSDKTIKGQKKLIVTGNIDNLKNPDFKNLRIYIPQQLNLHIDNILAQLKGDIFINGKLENAEIVGQLTLQNLFEQKTQTSINNGVLDFNKHLVTINMPNIKVGDSSFGINAVALNTIKDAIVFKNMNIKSKYINLDTMMMHKNFSHSSFLPIIVNNGHFYAEKLSSSMYDNQLYLSALTSDFTLDNNKVVMNNLSSELYNGKLSGKIDYDINKDYYNADIMARSVSAAPIFGMISNKKETVSGTMDFDTLLHGILNSKQELNGTAKFIIHNGRMGTLGKLEHLLYAQNVLADSILRTSLSTVVKAVTLKDTGLFKYLRGNVDIANGIVNIKCLQSQGPYMALFVKGQYNTINDYAQLVVLGRLSDEVISGLGAFGEFSLNKLMIMLTGDESRYRISAEDLSSIPQLTAKNTKEFRSIINGIADKTSSVIMFNWISCSQKSLKQKDTPMTNISVPSFIEELPY